MPSQEFTGQIPAETRQGPSSSEVGLGRAEQKLSYTVKFRPKIADPKALDLRPPIGVILLNKLELMQAS